MINIVTMAWAKNYVHKVMAGITTGLKPKIVSELPTSNVDVNYLYLVPVADGEGHNYYDEYLYVDDKWEKISSTRVDLDGYVTTDELNQLLEEALNQALEESGALDSITPEEVDEICNGTIVTYLNSISAEEVAF